MKQSITQPLPQNTRVYTVSRAMAQAADSVTALLRSGEFRHHVAHTLEIGEDDNWSDFKYVCFDEVLIPECDEIAVCVGKTNDDLEQWIYEGKIHYFGNELRLAMYKAANGE